MQAKKEPKPRRSKYLTESDYQKLLREWESKQPHDVEVKSKENFMTNKYYMNKLLLGLLKIINEHKAAERRAILQENNDPSHETIGRKDSLARSFKQDNNIELLKHGHSAQSLDLNSHEGIWNILKQRVRRRKWHTLKELKEIILEEWDRITMKEIRARISEMPWRCEQLVKFGGKPIKSELW